MIGILGGTFDPPHWGHVRLAENFIKKLGLKELIWLPAGQPWQKSQEITPSQIRYQLTLAAAAELANWVETQQLKVKIGVDRLELDRHGPSYTIDTALLLRQRHGPNTPIVWLMGEDSYNNIPTWKGWQDLLGLIHIAVASRPHAPSVTPPLLIGAENDTLNQLKQAELEKKRIFGDNVTRNPAELSSKPFGRVFFDESFRVDLSSNRLREDLKQDLSEEELLKAIPPRVLELIHSLGIYQQRPAL